MTHQSASFAMILLSNWSLFVYQDMACKCGLVEKIKTMSWRRDGQ